MVIKSVATGLVMLAVGMHFAQGAEIVLVAEGAPACGIVLPADAPEVLETAAEDLRHYIAALSGVSVPIHRDGVRARGSGLYIGACEPARASDLPAAELNPESYAIRVREGDIFFSGRHPTPTAFAVYSFIEGALGVRWFAPGDLWEHVPGGTPGELRVTVDVGVTVPGTSPRIWSGHGWYPRWTRWNLRNKTTSGEVIPRRQFQNRLHAVFPSATYAEEHPEYYPLIDGRRFIPPAGMVYWRPCESNPEVQRATVQFARRWFDSRPTVDSFSVGMDDISHLCGCAHCRSLDAGPAAYEQRAFSDRHYRFVNRIARDLARTHPDRYVGTLIYNVARDLPRTVERLEPNVFGYITETSAQWWQEERRAADQALTRAWARRCRHLSRYDYYGMGCMTPRYYPHAVAEQIAFDKSLGMKGMYIEVYTFLPHTAPMIWLTAKLQWDHRQSPDALLAEFQRCMYGPAAPVMGRYWDLLEASWNTARAGRDSWVHRRIEVQALAMSPEDVDAAFVLLDEALAACEDAKQRQRIAIHRDALRFSSYAIYAAGLSADLQGLDIRDRALADLAVTKVAELGRLSQERVLFHEQVRQRDDLLGLNVRALTETIAYMPISDFQKLESGGYRAAMAALEWYRRHAPEAVQAPRERLEALPEGSLGDILRATLYALAEKPENILQNSNFEQTSGGAPAAAEADWRVAGAPPGWNVWSRTPRARFEIRNGLGMDGRAAATISGASSGVYIQIVPAEAGARFLCTTRVKVDGTVGKARLEYRFRTVDGQWHPRRDLEGSVVAVSDDSGWQLLAVLIEAPEDTGSVVVMVGAGGQTEDDLAVFDEVSLYRLPAK